MSSDYEYSDDDGEYYDDEEMIDGTQDEGQGHLLHFVLFCTQNFRLDVDEGSGDEMMDNFGDDFKVAPKGKQKSYEVEYESLSQQAVENMMQQDVDHICGIFGVDVSRSLLFPLLTWLRCLLPLTGGYRASSAPPHEVEQRKAYRKVHGQSHVNAGRCGCQSARGFPTTTCTHSWQCSYPVQLAPPCNTWLETLGPFLWPEVCEIPHFSYGNLCFAEATAETALEESG